MCSNLGDVHSLWSEVTACQRALAVSRVLWRWRAGGGLPGTVFLGSAGVSSSSKNVSFTLAQDVWTLGLVFFLFQVNLKSSLLCSSVFSLTAVSFTCPEKVFASSRGGDSPAVLPSLPLPVIHPAVWLLALLLRLMPILNVFSIILICV